MAASARRTGHAGNQPGIICTAQQTRFHSSTLDMSREIDLKEVTVSIGQNELIESSDLRLKAGVRYALIGRNGSGKSTLMRAIAGRLIPGLSAKIRVLLLSQVDDGSRAEANPNATVLSHVINGDKDRLKLLERQKALLEALNAPSSADTKRILDELRLAHRQAELLEAQKIAARRSGARGKDARLAEVKAEREVEEARKALENVAVSANQADDLKAAGELLAEVEMELNLINAEGTEARASSILVGLGFSQEMIDGSYSALSGGWRSRCSLAIALLVQGDCLMLDEPSNFLDLEATLWLESFLVSQSYTLVVTSHDQAFLDNVAEETIHVRHKKMHYFEGTPSAADINRRKEAKRAAAVKDTMDRKKEHMEKSITQGKALAKKTGDENKARMAKSRQRKLDERWGVETSAKGGRFKLNRDLVGWHLTNRAVVTAEAGEAPPKVIIPSPERLRTREDLITFDDVGFWHPGAKKVVVEGVTFSVPQGGRCVFLGNNGQGKSTLAKLIVGVLQPRRGTIVRHPMLRVGYYSQHSVEELTRVHPSTTALTYFIKTFEDKGEKVEEQDARACLGSFGLRGKTVSDTALAVLSGGQKVRVALAVLVYRPPPLLLLDEPTTHVDAPTIEALGKALRSYTGGIILVTHDRWFSRAVIEGDSFSCLRREQVGVAGSGNSSGEDSSSDEQDGGDGRPHGATYRVHGGKVKELIGGMVEYVELTEKRLAKRGKASA